LKHKLSEGERVAFERQLQQDPLLQNEVNLQRDIAASLAEVRKAELKARLDAIPVDSPVAWYGLSSVKWMAAAITAVTLSVASYLYFSAEDEAIHQPVVSLDENATILERKAKVNKPAPVEEFINEAQTPQTPVAEHKDNTSDAVREVLSEKKTNTQENVFNTENKAVKLPEIVRPDIKADFDDDFQTKEYDDVQVPEKGLAQVEGVSAPNIEIENDEDAEYAFHYRYVDNKLYLYGDFKGIPYEILALNTAEKTRLFLKYDSNFYMINSLQTEVVPLEPIENQALINELKIVSDFK
jgi:hypothetical protein